MADSYSTRPILHKLLSHIVFLGLGVCIGYFAFRPVSEFDHKVITFGDKAVTVKEIEKATTREEREGNSEEYQRQIAQRILESKVLDDLAAKEGLSRAEYINKVKAGANTDLSEVEISQFMTERKFDRSKLSKDQYANILANMKEHKRELFFNEHFQKILNSMKVIESKKGTN